MADDRFANPWSHGTCFISLGKIGGELLDLIVSDTLLYCSELGNPSVQISWPKGVQAARGSVLASTQGIVHRPARPFSGTSMLIPSPKTMRQTYHFAWEGIRL